MAETFEEKLRRLLDYRDALLRKQLEVERKINRLSESEANEELRKQWRKAGLELINNARDIRRLVNSSLGDD